MIKSGKVEELKVRLAAHYGLDRSASASASVVPTTGPLSLDKHIQKKQWDHLRDLGHEWAQTASAGHEFKLCASSKGTLRAQISDLYVVAFTNVHVYTLLEGTISVPVSLRQDIKSVLSRLTIQPESGPTIPTATTQDISDVSNETILAWIGAAESGSSTARKNLQQLQQCFDSSSKVNLMVSFFFAFLIGGGFRLPFAVLQFNIQPSLTLQHNLWISCRRRFRQHSFQRSTIQHPPQMPSSVVAPLHHSF